MSSSGKASGGGAILLSFDLGGHLHLVRLQGGSAFELKLKSMSSSSFAATAKEDFAKPKRKQMSSLIKASRLLGVKGFSEAKVSKDKCCETKRETDAFA